jgi:hypothetical protein
MEASLTPVFMSDKVYDELVGIMRNSYANVCVLYIDKVNNKKLETAYEKRREAFGEYANEKRLFHGSSVDAISSITTNGYNAKKNIRAAFGPGTYFSSAASYSKDYSNTIETGESYMIVNRVLLGKNTLSTNGRYIGDSGGDGKTIFVTAHDDAALPEYVICFHKNAMA